MRCESLAQVVTAALSKLFSQVPPEPFPGIVQVLGFPLGTILNSPATPLTSNLAEILVTWREGSAVVSVAVPLGTAVREALSLGYSNPELL